MSSPFVFQLIILCSSFIVRFDDLYPHRAFARAVEFAKENGLPAPQLQCRVLDEKRLAAAGHQGFNVRGAVTFLMRVVVFVRHLFL